MNVRKPGSDAVHDPAKQCKSLKEIRDLSSLEETVDEVTCHWCRDGKPGRKVSVSSGPANGAPKPRGRASAAKPVSDNGARVRGRPKTPAVPVQARVIKQAAPAQPLTYSQVLERTAMDLLKLAFLMEQEGR